jgi:16S rRNA (adenine1518-N6/adenine1519-N6)-dimethyltransferase
MGNFEFKKKFGQNFLTDKNLLNTIVEKSGTTNTDTVIEIGAGKGALTEVLSLHAKKVISFEIDEELKEYLTQKFNGSNVQMVFEDVMNLSDDEINNLAGGEFKLVANLPYYITSPIITRFLKNKNMVSCTVMVQEEVADRIIASPKTKDYGVLSVICSVFGKPEKVLRVNRKMFFPVPNVDSAVVKITRKDNELNAPFEEFISFVKRAFSMRRKKLSTNIETEKFTKQMIEEELEKMGLGASARAEELSIFDFEKLFFVFNDKNK